MSIRSSEHASTGYSPALLNYGREMNSPMENALNDPNVDKMDDTTLANYIFENQNQIKKIQEFVIEQLKKVEKRNKNYYDKKHRSVEINVNDFVLLKSHFLSSKEERFVSKLAPKWLGPYKVVEKLSDVNYILEKHDGVKMGVQHISNLKRYFQRCKDVNCENVNVDENSARQKDNDFRVVQNPDNVLKFRIVKKGVSVTSEGHSMP
jgi:hypothetical protein